jgi:hypothetical protein
MTCPRCGSTNISSNKISEELIGKVLYGAQAMQHAGLRGPAVLGLGAAGVMKGLNSLRADWRCGNCDTRF